MHGILKYSPTVWRGLRVSLRPPYFFDVARWLHFDKNSLTVVNKIGNEAMNAEIVGGTVADITSSTAIVITKTTEENLYPNGDGLYCKREDTQAIVKSTISQSISNLEMVDLGYVVWFDSSLSTTITFKLNGITGETNRIHWGDGQITNVTYTSYSSGVTYSHTYTASSGLYYVIIEKNNYSFVEINSQNLKGNITNFNPSYYLFLYNLPLVTGVITNYNPSNTLYLNNLTNVTGDVSNYNISYYLYLSYLPNVTGVITNYNPSNTLYLNSLPNVTGDVSNYNTSYYLFLSYLPNVTGIITNYNPSYSLYLNNLPNVTGDVSNYNSSNRIYLYNIPNITVNYTLAFTTVKDITVYACNLSQNNVDKYLARAVSQNQTEGILNLGGTGNAAPSSQGLADKATLVSRGWTVTTNL